MSKYIKSFDTHSEYNTYITGSDKILPNVSYCINNNEVHYNPWTWAEKYLTFVALEDTTFTLSINAVNYSLDNGETWTELAANTATPLVTSGSSIMWKGTLTPTTSDGIGTFSATGNFEAKGNVMSLLFGDNFRGQTSLANKNSAFYCLFSNNEKLTLADKLALPATTLSDGCYQNMFQGCTSLTTAPELPATTLATSCYIRMFYGCTSLTTAPILPATELMYSCYNRMFRNCSNLNYVKALFTTTPDSSYTNEWLRSVAGSGIFVKNINATWDVTGYNGIPSGWTVETASE